MNDDYSSSLKLLWSVNDEAMELIDYTCRIIDQ